MTDEAGRIIVSHYQQEANQILAELAAKGVSFDGALDYFGYRMATRFDKHVAKAYPKIKDERTENAFCLVAEVDSWITDNPADFFFEYVYEVYPSYFEDGMPKGTGSEYRGLRLTPSVDLDEYAFDIGIAYDARDYIMDEIRNIESRGEYVESWMLTDAIQRYAEDVAVPLIARLDRFLAEVVEAELPSIFDSANINPGGMGSSEILNAYLDGDTSSSKRSKGTARRRDSKGRFVSNSTRSKAKPKTAKPKSKGARR